MIDTKTIRRFLKSKIGCRVVIIYYGSRNRKEKYIGYIYKIYDNVFIVKLFDQNIKSFSYKDIITKTLKVYI